MLTAAVVVAQPAAALVVAQLAAVPVVAQRAEVPVVVQLAAALVVAQLEAVPAVAQQGAVPAVAQLAAVPAVAQLAAAQQAAVLAEEQQSLNSVQTKSTTTAIAPSTVETATAPAHPHAQPFSMEHPVFSMPSAPGTSVSLKRPPGFPMAHAPTLQFAPWAATQVATAAPVSPGAMETLTVASPSAQARASRGPAPVAAGTFAMTPTQTRATKIISAAPAVRQRRNARGQEAVMGAIHGANYAGMSIEVCSATELRVPAEVSVKAVPAQAELRVGTAWASAAVTRAIVHQGAFAILKPQKDTTSASAIKPAPMPRVASIQTWYVRPFLPARRRSAPVTTSEGRLQAQTASSIANVVLTTALSLAIASEVRP